MVMFSLKNLGMFLSYTFTLAIDSLQSSMVTLKIIILHNYANVIQ